MKAYFLVMTTVLFSLRLNAAENLRPLFELGLGVGAGYVQDYPASDQYSLKQLVLPVVRYRGQSFRADEDDSGVRAEVVKHKELDFNISLSGSLPSKSQNNRARQGMPDLDYTIEMGPTLNYEISKNREQKIIMGLPLRGLVTTDFSRSEYLGVLFAPELSYETFGRLCAICRWTSRVSLTVVDQRVANYFYEVESKFSTQTRTSFDARPGYLGATFDQVVSFEWSSQAIYLGASYQNYSESANSQSPLFKQKEGFSLFLAFSWFFYQSVDREYTNPTLL